MLHLPLIRYVEVRETHVASPFKVSRGSVQVKDAIVREFPIYYCDNDRHQIGVLHVKGSLTDIYRDLLRQALVILVSSAAKTFLVALFILFMVHRLATRGSNPLSKAFPELVAPTSDRLVSHYHTALKEPLLNAAQAQLKAKYQRTAQLMISAGKR